MYSAGSQAPTISSPVVPHNLIHREFVGGFDGLAIACGAWDCRQANHSWRAEPAHPEPAPRCCWKRSRCTIKSPCWSASGTRRPCFRPWDRLFWILFSRWWPQWRDSLIIVQPETVLRWRRDGWLALWRYRSRGRWRGGRPRVSREVRDLIVRMARDNFLWGAPRGSMVNF